MSEANNAFRIGCGRYIQERGAIRNAGKEICRLAKKPLVIGGKTALSLTRAALVGTLGEYCNKYEIIEHTGTCNEQAASRYAALVKNGGYDGVVGVGGGVIMDLSKLVAAVASVPVVTIPTSSATCAAYTPLSVVYTEEGRTVGTRHFEREVDAVIVDTELLLSEPPRLFLAGVFDALAKYTEIIHRYRPGSPVSDSPIGLSYAYTLAAATRDVLTKCTPMALEAMKKGIPSREFDEVIYATVAVTGVVSGIARGRNQTALAHKFYENTRYLYPEASKPYLHGEIVGVGLLLQNYYNGHPEENESLTALMREYSMPSSVSELGIPTDREALTAYTERIVGSSAISADSPEQCAAFEKSINCLFNMKR